MKSSEFADKTQKGSGAKLAMLLKVAGGLILILGIWGFFLCLGIAFKIAVAFKIAGYWGIVLAVIFGPVSFIAIPLYSGFALNDWYPLIFSFGGSFVGMGLISAGMHISRD